MMLFENKIAIPAVVAALLLVSTIQDVAEAEKLTIRNEEGQVIQNPTGWYEDQQGKSFFGYKAGKAGVFGDLSLTVANKGAHTFTHELGIGAVGVLVKTPVMIYCANAGGHQNFPFNVYQKCTDIKYQKLQKAKDIIGCPIKRYNLENNISCYATKPSRINESLLNVADRYKNRPNQDMAIKGLIDQIKAGAIFLKELGWYYRINESTVEPIDDKNVRFVKLDNLLPVKSRLFFKGALYKQTVTQIDNETEKFLISFLQRFNFDDAKIANLLKTEFKDLFIQKYKGLFF
ncbi:hypothetical protein BDF19DRAFT_463908 [Syncephalis fuscata]|nr:hypothetical protein BDF19DRAFT_463908 [Syncephalis fuscata]